MSSAITLAHQCERKAQLAESPVERQEWFNVSLVLEAQQREIQELRRQLNAAHERAATDREWASI